jgi:hypothetical protein
MILAPLAGLSLAIAISTGPMPDVTGSIASHASLQQKAAEMQPLVRSATECIARAVAADPRLGKRVSVGDLIVDSMPACADAVRAMIDGYDRGFGDGSGEAFFMGPYLDVLPKAVSKWIEEGRGR